MSCLRYVAYYGNRTFLVITEFDLSLQLSVVYLLHCALASSAVYCNRSCLCVWRAGRRCLLPR